MHSLGDSAVVSGEGAHRPHPRAAHWAWVRWEKEDRGGLRFIQGSRQTVCLNIEAISSQGKWILLAVRTPGHSLVVSAVAKSFPGAQVKGMPSPPGPLPLLLKQPGHPLPKDQTSPQKASNPFFVERGTQRLNVM